MTADSMSAAPTETSRGSDGTIDSALIMLVEDDFMLRSSLTELLRGAGYRVECYANGVDALERLGQPSAPDLILLDIMLPYMDGVKFRERQLASTASNIPVVVITAVGVPADRSRALRFDRVFRKPLDIPALLDAIRELCPPQTS